MHLIRKPSVSENCKKGFTLIELLIVITIVGILASIALPMYLGQTTSAKLVEVTNALSYVATAVSIYHQEAVQNGASNIWPKCDNVTEIQTTLGVGIPSGRISTASVDQSTGVISLSIKNIDNEVNGKTISLTPSLAPDSTISWEWGGTIPSRYRPKK